MEHITNAHNMRMGQANHGLLVFIATLFWGPFVILVAAFLQQDSACKTGGIVTSILQYLACCFFGIGWLWSIFNGFKIWQNSK